MPIPNQVQGKPLDRLLMQDLALFLDLSSDAIFVRDLEGTIRFWSHGAETLYQWSAAEAVGRRSQELLHTRFPRPQGEIEAEAVSRGRWVGELEHRRRDGGRVIVMSRWAQATGTHAPQSIVEFNTDITEHKRAEQALRDSELRYRALLESAPDAIVTADSEGRIVMTNRQVEACFGYTSNELIGKPLEQLVPVRLAEVHRQRRREYARHPSTRPMGQALDLVAMRKDGSEFPVEISLSPLRLGNTMLVTAVIRDISHRKQAEQELRRLHTLELAQTEHLATLGEIAAGLAHEIKNPLAAMAAALEVIAPAMAGEAQQAIMGEVRAQVVRIKSTLEDLLQYARPRPLQLEAGRLNATVEHAVQLAAGRAQARRVTLRFGGGALPPVTHDADQVHRMVLNLVLNALDAVGEGGAVEVSTGVRDHGRAEALIQVHDNGAGIPAAELTHIFRPFYTTKGAQGSGLGLSLCRRIAELHGGRIEVRSAPGQGSTFIASLPLGEQA